MADRISLRKARGGPTPEPTPSRSERDAELVRKALVEEAERQLDESVGQYLDGWGDDPIDATTRQLHIGGTVTGRMSGGPQPIQEIPRSLSAPPPRTGAEQSIFDRARSLLGIRQTPSDSITGRAQPAMAPPTHSVVPAQVPRVTATQQRRNSDGMVINSWDDIQTRQHVYMLGITHVVLETRINYELMEMDIPGNADEKAEYWSRTLAQQLTAPFEQELRERLYELIRNNRRIG